MTGIPIGAGRTFRSRLCCNCSGLLKIHQGPASAFIHSHERKRRCQLPGEVVDPEIGAVGAKFLGRNREIDRLQQHV